MRKQVKKENKCTGDVPADSPKEEAPVELGVLLFYYAVILEVIL